VSSVARPWGRGSLAVLALAVSILLTSMAHALAAEAVTVSASDVRTNGDQVSGVLTLRSKAAVLVDPTSLKAWIDGEPHAISIKQGAPPRRSAMLVIDTSGSMGAGGMATVRQATATYLRQVPSDVRVGIVSFATTAGVDLAPTTSRADVQKVADGLVSRGDTALYAAVQSAVRSLGSSGDRSVVLLSDGADTIAKDGSAARDQAIAALKKAGIRVDVVRFRSNDPDALPALKGFASSNGGTLVSGDDTAAVVAAFQASAKALDSQVPFEIAAGSVLTGVHNVRLSGSAGGAPFTVTRTVNLGPAAAPRPSPTTPAVADPSPPLLAGAPEGASIGSSSGMLSQPWLLWLAAVLVGLAMFLALGAMLSPSLHTRKERRVASIDDYVASVRLRSRSEGKPQTTAMTEHLIDFGDRAMKDRRGTKSTMALIDRADLPLRAGEWFLIRGLAVIVGTAIGALLLGDVPFLGMAIGGALGLLIPPATLRYLARRRADRFERTLPDVLMLVATTLSSGFGLPQALDAVARDAADPAAKEFSRALAETRIGTDISDALERMSVRMDSTAMRWAVMAIRIQREVGGNLADTLRTTASTLRERESLRRQIQTLSAEGRLSAVILILLPIGIFLYMMQANYDYVSMLWTTSTGLMMSAFGIIMIIIGSIWMRKIVQIEV
jgi:tight adherence protein B